MVIGNFVDACDFGIGVVMRCDARPLGEDAIHLSSRFDSVLGITSVKTERGG